MFIVLILEENMLQPLFDLYNSEWCFPAQNLKDDPEVPCRPLGFGSCWTPSLHRSAWRFQRRECPHLGKDQGVSTRPVPVVPHKAVAEVSKIANL